MKKIVGICLIFCLLLCACGQSAEATWQEQYDLGVRYLSEGNYQEAIIAFTAAIEIDPKRPDAYEGLADVYEAQGDLESLRAILEQGFQATGDARLQEALEALAEGEPLTVLVCQTAYRPDGTMCAMDRYAYNEQGYLISKEESHYSETGAIEGTYTDRWEYEGEPGQCRFIPDRQYYDSEEAWQAEWTEEWLEPGTCNYLLAASGMGYSICVDPLLDTEKAEKVLASSGTHVHEDPPENENFAYWATADYTFSEDGYPVAVTSYYADGTVSGSAVLEWETIRPAGGE